MKEQLTKQQAKEILDSLDNAIEKGPWDESNFLKVIGKNLKEIRDDFASHLGEEEQQKIASNLADRVALRSGQQEVFIALYSTDGSKLHSWERILANLPRQMISRPVYNEEKDVKEMLRTKENKVNEAYVSIYVNQTEVLPVPSEKIPVDKLGKALLTLKNNAIKLNNINRFVHHSGAYKYANGRLTKINSSETE